MVRRYRPGCRANPRGARRPAIRQEIHFATDAASLIPGCASLLPVFLRRVCRGRTVAGSVESERYGGLCAGIGSRPNEKDSVLLAILAHEHGLLSIGVEKFNHAAAVERVQPGDPAFLVHDFQLQTTDRLRLQNPAGEFGP